MKNGKFVKIQDGVIIKKDSLTGYRKDKYDPRGCHYYIAMYDTNKKSYSMYPTSHYIDPAKATDVRRKRAILMNIKGAPGMSTVYNQPRKKDVNGNYFKDSFQRYESVGQLTKYQQRRLKLFLKSSSQKNKKQKRSQ